MDKLNIKGGFDTLEDFLENNDFEILPINFDDTKALLGLEVIHRDPFDRIIISQAITSGLIIITKDKHIKNYNVDIIW